MLHGLRLGPIRTHGISNPCLVLPRVSNVRCQRRPLALCNRTCACHPKIDPYHNLWHPVFGYHVVRPVNLGSSDCSNKLVEPGPYNNYSIDGFRIFVDPFTKDRAMYCEEVRYAPGKAGSCSRVFVGPSRISLDPSCIENAVLP